jgi:hypothetical protein
MPELNVLCRRRQRISRHSYGADVPSTASTMCSSVISAAGRASRKPPRGPLGVDLLAGTGLDEALAGVDAVVDATNAPPADRDGTVRGREVRLVPAWSGPFGPEMAGDVLLPGEGAGIAPTTFDEWLATQRQPAQPEAVHGAMPTLTVLPRSMPPSAGTT